MINDSQQTRLYFAQSRAFLHTELNELISDRECTRLKNLLFNKAISISYWRSPLTPAIYTVKSLPEDWVATATSYIGSFIDSKIELLAEGKRSWIIAHESAHILLNSKITSISYEAHGPEFAGIYIWAVNFLFGRKWSNTLKREFRLMSIKSVHDLKER